ncbi:Beta-catenin-like protein 1 [Schistosoma japonicum]|nr:Beta-catenin-like protein 1 [Schistosoma japonicum]
MSSSSSSSSSLLYINVLLLVLIHSSIQQGILNDAISNATRELLQAQDLKNRYLSSIVNTRNSINQKRDEDCQIEVHHKELVNRLLTKHSEKIIKELNKDIVNMEKHLEKLENEKEIEMCDEPENIDSNVKEEHLSELIKILKNSAEKTYLGFAANPELYPIIAEQTRPISLLLGISAHKNTDTNETKKDEADGVHKTLGIVESLLEIRPDMNMTMANHGLFS